MYIINACYMLPVTLFVYFRYGRPSKPNTKSNTTISDQDDAAEPKSQGHCHGKGDAMEKTTKACHTTRSSSQSTHEPGSRVDSTAGAVEKAGGCNSIPTVDNLHSTPERDNMHHCHQTARPMYATILVGVSHCGAGCVLGDIVGEWLVYGSGASINGHSIWVELLVDYAFALLFGILFQYFSIAPMSGEYGIKTFWRAAKADVLSLTSFEVGAFGWMVIYQVGIFGYKLSMTTWTCVSINP